MAQDTNNNTASDDCQCFLGEMAVRANLLRWATLTLDGGIEWQLMPTVRPELTLVVDGTWTHWSWDTKNRHYSVGEIAPQLRWHFKDTRWYAGIMYKWGSFNYKLGDSDGKQGYVQGGGIVGGYRLPVGKSGRWVFDFSLGLGYLHAWYNKWYADNGVRVRRWGPSGHDTKDWWGPISAAVTISYTFKK